MVSDDVKRSLALARTLRAPWEPRWQRLTELAMPYRTHIQSGSPETRHGENPGTIYDETGMVSIEEFASRLLSGIVPDGIEWARFEVAAGRASGALLAQVLAKQQVLFHELSRCNFAPEMFDGFKDLAGYGNFCMAVDHGDWSQPLVFQAIPLADAWITPGPHGGYADIHVRHWMPPEVVRAQYPHAEIPPDEARGKALLDVTDSWIRDLTSPTPRWRNQIHLNGKVLLQDRIVTGRGGCRYVFGRWSKASGELYGVGQGMLALPAIEVLNDAMRLILAHGEMALSGMWQAEDDGVLNPWAVQLAPGSIIPIAQGSRGLMPLPLPQTRLDIGQIVLEEQRHAIRKALYSETMGAREGTPPTAFEIQERQAELARQIGPAYGRVWHEVVLGVLFRAMRILDDRGLTPPVEVDGEKVRIVAASSLVRSARIGEARRMQEWAATTGQVFGPAAVQTLVKAEEFVRRTAEIMDIPGDLLYSPEEIQRNAQRAGELAGAAAGDPSGQAGAAMAPLLAALGGGA